MTDQRPAWSRESVMLRLPGITTIEDFSPEWAFDGSSGAGVRVAVIDSGVEATHPMLVGAIDIDGGVEFSVDETGSVARRDGPHADVYGHGTACAGIIHALAPDAVITSVRVLDEGLRGKAAAFHAGLTWAVDHGFDVINLSLGAAKREWALAFHDTCDRGYFANSFIVTAANNINRESFPSLFASVTSVASNNSSDPLRFHFNPEPPTEFLARGIDVEVPWLDGTTIVTTGNSFAAPHIAGFAALIKAKHPHLRPFQIKTALWAASANVRESVLLDRAGRGTTATPGRRSIPAPVAGPAGPPVAPPRPFTVGLDERDEIQALMADYRVGPLLARGPWGPVYSAIGDDGAVALRRLDPALASDAGTRARFATSVRIAAGLRHPHILPIIELREHDYFAVMVMPLCPSNLALERGGGRLPPAAAVTAVLSVLRGLHFAHRSGIYHGDLRPENALVDRQQRVVVSDVGIAAALTSDVRTSSAPNDPSSWRYLAPEQLDGSAIGAYTDVHAAGLLLFELMTGHLPYPTVTRLGELVRQRAAAGPRSLAELDPDLPGDLVAVADRAVATDAAVRFPSVEAFAAALAGAAELELGPRWAQGQPFVLVDDRPRSAPVGPGPIR
ncbi:MAG: S8 family serine peptidase [Acidimicrobiales bacterium]